MRAKRANGMSIALVLPRADQALEELLTQFGHDPAVSADARWAPVS
jgi:hypothetical protein